MRRMALTAALLGVLAALPTVGAQAATPPACRSTLAVKVYYAVPNDSRLMTTAIKTEIRAVLEKTDAYLKGSGGVHRFVWQCNGEGQVHITRKVVTGPNSPYQNFWASVQPASPDPIYLAMWSESQAGPNYGDKMGEPGPGVAWIHRTWKPEFVLHELGHTIGAVHDDAPHATANGHCWDEPDVMCYDDGGLPPGGLQVRCPGGPAWYFDCNHDDYYDPTFRLSPTLNVADSPFLTVY